MRDRMDAEIWNAHHDQFSYGVGNLAAGAGSTLRGSGSLAGRVPAQLLAGLFAVSFTLALFGGSAA